MDSLLTPAAPNAASLEPEAREVGLASSVTSESAGR